MKVEQTFEVAAPLERVWEALIDVERVAPCLPGATVTGRNEDGSFNGEFTVKLGPTSANYSGKLTLDSVDADGHTATMLASGTDKRGQGNAKTAIVSSATAAGDGATRVAVESDYQITGRLARFGRGGMIEEISERLLAEFAVNLQELLGGAAPPVAAEPVAAEPAVAEPVAAEPVAAEPPVAEPAVDPDDVIEGATPVAPPDTGVPAAESPVQATAEQAIEDTDERAAADPIGPPPYTPVTESDSGALASRSTLSRVRENPAPFAALVVGFLIALRVLRRRD